MGLAPHYAEGVVGLVADFGENYVRLAAVQFLFQGSFARASAGHDDGSMVDSLGHSNHSEEAELESLVTG